VGDGTFNTTKARAQLRNRPQRSLNLTSGGVSLWLGDTLSEFGQARIVVGLLSKLEQAGAGLLILEHVSSLASEGGTTGSKKSEEGEKSWRSSKSDDVTHEDCHARCSASDKSGSLEGVPERGTPGERDHTWRGATSLGNAAPPGGGPGVRGGRRSP
jgi:hypothetical protein